MWLMLCKLIWNPKHYFVVKFLESKRSVCKAYSSLHINQFILHKNNWCLYFALKFLLNAWLHKLFRDSGLNCKDIWNMLDNLWKSELLCLRKPYTHKLDQFQHKIQRDVEEHSQRIFMPSVLHGSLLVSGLAEEARDLCSVSFLPSGYS